MARSRLSIHAIPVHDPDAVIRFAQAIQPPVILIVDPDPNFISRIYQASPGTLFSLRNHPLSEQKSDLYADPAGTGDRHAREMVEWCDKIYAEAARRGLPMPPLNQVILPGVNEPLVGTDEEVGAVVTYNVHYLNGLTERGRRGSCLEWSVGWPKNAGHDTAPQWGAWWPVHEAAKRGNHIPVVHEYWPNEGPGYWAGWLCYRLVRWVPDEWTDLPFIITECGLDDAAAPGRPHRFWKDFFLQNPQIYVDQYAEYERNCRTLTNQNGKRVTILGYCIFTCDYGGNEWEGADIKPITNLFTAYVNSAVLPDDFTIHLPEIEAPDDGPTIPTPQPGTTNNIANWSIEALSRVFGYDPDMAKAIIRVESGDRPLENGRPIIRNELHILYDKMTDKAKWHDHFRIQGPKQWEGQQWRPSVGMAWQNFHGDQDAEWRVFEFAKKLDSRAAYLSIGMGIGQMMGFNYHVPGYNTPEEMLAAFADPNVGIANQIAAMFAYFYKNNMVEDIRAGNLENIAAKYNGPGQVAYYVQRFKEELDAIAHNKN